jgi:hypothetical protein
MPNNKSPTYGMLYTHVTRLRSMSFTVSCIPSYANDTPKFFHGLIVQCGGWGKPNHDP